jgi:hypothetical protein
VIEVTICAELDASGEVARGEIKAVLLLVSESQIGVGASGEVIETGINRELETAFELLAAPFFGGGERGGADSDKGVGQCFRDVK